MALADYIRSTPFRIGAAYAITFAVSVVVLFAAVYALSTDELKSALRHAIDQDIASLTAAYQKRGKPGLRAAIADRIADTGDTSSFYVLRDANGDLGSEINLPGDLAVGWQEAQVREKSGTRDEEGVAERFLVRGVQLDGTFFAVGRSLLAVTEVQEVLLRALAWALGLTALMAIIAGIGLGHGAQGG